MVLSDIGNAPFWFVFSATVLACFPLKFWNDEEEAKAKGISKTFTPWKLVLRSMQMIGALKHSNKEKCMFFCFFIIIISPRSLLNFLEQTEQTISWYIISLATKKELIQTSVLKTEIQLQSLRLLCSEISQQELEG